MNTRASTQSQVPRLRISLPLIIAGMLLTGTMAQAVDISAPDVVFQKNQTVLPGDGSTDLAISIDGVLATDAVTSVDLVVTYDSAVAAPVLPIITTGTVINGWFTAANIVNNPGTIDEIRISAASSTALGDISTPADLVIIQFTTEDTDGILSTAVTFTTAELNEALVSVNATNGSIALGGSDGTVDLTPSDQIAGNPFDLVLTDLDLDGFTPLPSVVVERYDPADPPPPAGTGVPIETVTIDLSLATESPAGTFTYSLETVFDDGSILDSSDLILGIQAGDLIDVVYQDDPRFAGQ